MSQPCQCMDCTRWFVASGQIVDPPRNVREVSTGLCPDCYVVRIAPFQPHTIAAWVSDARTSAQQIAQEFSAVIPSGFNGSDTSPEPSRTTGASNILNPSPVTA